MKFGAHGRRLSSLLLAMLIATGPAFSAELPRFWARAQTSGSVMQAALDGCVRDAKDVHITMQDPVYIGQNLVAQAIGKGLAEAAQEQAAHAAFVVRCMRAGGYVRVRMTPEEAIAFNALKTSADKGAWAQTLYDKPDFPARLDAASKPPVPPLPTAKEESLTYEGLRFDPTKLTPGSGLLKKGDQVLSGKVLHRQTAQLTEDLVVPIILASATAKKGDLFYQAVMPGPEGLKRTYWCGQLTVKDFIRTHPDQYCFYTDDDGYVAVLADGLEWHLNNLPDTKPSHFSDPKLVLQESPADLIGSMDFAIIISKIDQNSISYKATLKKDWDSETFWTRTVPFDANGTAVLPFWDHRLVAIRSGDGVSVAFSADGDGKGWNDSSGS